MCTHWYNFYVERSSLSSAEPHVVLYLTAEKLTHAFNSHKFARGVSPGRTRAELRGAGPLEIFAG